MRARTLALISFSLIAACIPGDDPPPEILAETLIGPAGGTVSSLDGASLEIPAGALAAETTITITTTSATTPGALGRAYAFGPEGIVLSVPGTVKLPFDPARIPNGKTTNDLMIWSAPQGGAGFVQLAGSTVDGSRLRVPAARLSTFVIAVAPAPPASSYFEVTVDGRHTHVDCAHLDRNFVTEQVPEDGTVNLGAISQSTGIHYSVIAPATVMPFQDGSVPGDYPVADGEAEWSIFDPLLAFKVMYPTGTVRYVSVAGGPDATTHHRVELRMVSSTASSITYRITGTYRGTMRKYDTNMPQVDLGEHVGNAVWSQQLTFPKH